METKKMLNTVINFEFFDGTTAELTLAFYKLYQLKAKNRGLYTRYCEAMNNSSKSSYDELDMITVLYTAYMCANMDNSEIMSEEEFMMKCGSDRVAVANAVKELTSPKKQMVSKDHS